MRLRQSILVQKTGSDASPSPCSAAVRMTRAAQHDDDLMGDALRCTAAGKPHRRWQQMLNADLQELQCARHYHAEERRAAAA